MRTLIVGRFATGWPDAKQPASALPVTEHVLSIDGALNTSWDWDAHIVQYAPVVTPGGNSLRLKMHSSGTTDGLLWKKLADGQCEAIKMLFAIFDADAPEHAGTPEYWSKIQRGIAALPAKERPLWYATAGGARLVYRLAAPFVIQTPDGYAAWRQEYLSWLHYLERQLDVPLDQSCKDFTRLFRLPIVKRDDGKACPATAPEGGWGLPPVLELKPSVKDRKLAKQRKSKLHEETPVNPVDEAEPVECGWVDVPVSTDVRDSVRDLLAQGMGPGQRNAQAYSAACVLTRAGWAETDVRSIVAASLEKAGCGAAEHEIACGISRHDAGWPRIEEDYGTAIKEALQRLLRPAWYDSPEAREMCGRDPVPQAEPDPEPAPSADPAPVFLNRLSDGRPAGRTEAEINREVSARIHSIPELYAVDDLWADIRGGKTCFVAEGHVRHLISEHVPFREYKQAAAEDGGEVYESLVCSPPGYLLAYLKDNARATTARQIRGVITHPILHPDGTLVTKRGYDPVSRYVLAGEALELLTMTTDAAIDLLNELVCDFPLSELGRASYMALLFTLVCRTAVDACVPGWLLDSSQKKAGKGLLVNVAGLIASGVEPVAIPAGTNDEKLDERIESKVLEQPRLLFVDDITKKLGSTYLLNLLTARSVRATAKYVREQDIEFNGVFIGTGNNLALARGSDLDVRCLAVRMTPEWSDVAERQTVYKHPELEAWVLANRARLLSAIFTIMSDWLRSGEHKQFAGDQSPDGATLARMPKFEVWRMMIAACVAVYWGVDPIASNKDLKDAASDDSAEDQDLLDVLAKRFGAGELFGTGDVMGVLDVIETRDDLWKVLEPHMPSRVDVRDVRSKMVNDALSRLRDRVSANGLRLVKTRDKHRKGWKIEIVRVTAA